MMWPMSCPTNSAVGTWKAMIAGTANRDRASTSVARAPSVTITTHAITCGHGSHGTCCDRIRPDENAGHSLFTAANP